MSFDKVVEDILETSESIGKGYLEYPEIVKYIEDSKSTVCIYDSTDKVIKYTGDESINDVYGFLLAKRYENIDNFKSEVKYSNQYINYIDELDFPISNLKSIAVRPDKRGMNVGTKMASFAMSMYVSNGCRPITAKMWKKSNGNNGHISTAESLGGEVIKEYDEFLPNIYCNICNVKDCDCSEVILVFK